MLRRAAGVVVCLLPLWLACASLLSANQPSQGRVIAASVLTVLAMLLAAMNVSTLWIRPWLYKRRHGTLEGFQYISGIPAVGTVLLCLAETVSFGSPMIAVSAILLSAMDGGSLPWFLVATWNDESLWNSEGHAPN